VNSGKGADARGQSVEELAMTSSGPLDDVPASSASFRSTTRTCCVCIAIATCILFASACGRKNKRVAAVPPTPAPAPSSAPRATPPGARQPAKSAAALPIGYTEEGVASWYGIPYHGRKAADGEVYDMETLVAAHRVMPFNTWLKVTNLANSKTVNVRIIDRGPFVDGRLIDLSKAAARQIALIGPGIGRVRLEVIAAPADIPADDFYAVQVGAFSVYETAERIRAGFEQRFGVAKLVPKLGTVPMWRVLVGKEPTVAGAQQIANTLNSEKRDVFVVRLDEKLPTPAPIPPPAVWQTPETVTFDPHAPAVPGRQPAAIPQTNAPQPPN
jgi:rare lipoprotein A